MESNRNVKVSVTFLFSEKYFEKLCKSTSK
uniref:Uncharacterized protein n=1 Tax=Phage sp. ctqZP6 TaxID=2828010 RepID=A0A8S5SI27_9VIRU|nr:MAG TPA: hypothetical protein [Phage sp. ctqZP6]